MLYYLKLVSGEELLSDCKVNASSVKLDNPLLVTRTFTPNGPSVVLVPWVTIVELNSLEFEIDHRQIITMSEIIIDSISSQYYQAVSKIDAYMNKEQIDEELEQESEPIDEFTANTDLMIQPTKKGTNLN